MTPTIGATRPAPQPRPGDSLRAARVILDRPEALASPGWARSVALLARQALEDAVDAFWARHAPGMQRATRKSRFVALRFYIDDPDLARHAHHVWATLSDAAHYHGYDLAPTAGELRTWLHTVSDLVARLTSSSGGGPQPGRHAGDGAGEM